LDAKYLAYILRAQESDVVRQVETAAHGTKRLKTETIEQLEIPLPSKVIQQQIVMYLDSVEAELVEVEQIQTLDGQLLDQVEQSILDQAFRGEL
jgi:type I restriction enzyme S subunit